MSEWQPIKTAPIDGSKILAVGGNFGDYSKGFHILIVRRSYGRWVTVGAQEENDEDYDEELDALDSDNLTHWQPLPSPPANSQSDE